MNNIIKFLESILLLNYNEELRESEHKIIMQIAHGNILVQEGRYLNNEDHKKLIEKGDIAWERLKKAID